VIRKLARQAREQKHLLAGVVAAALMVGLPCVKFRQYAYAVAWHCVHGNYAEIGHHKVRLPAFWWKEDAYAFDTSVLRGARPAGMYDSPEITLSPAIPGEARDSDQDELKSTEAFVSSRNHDPFAGTSSHLVVLSPAPFRLYCKREDIEMSGLDLSSNLFCHAARVPYSFTYDGPPTREREAELILSSLQ
jgi:hypothetical protein